MFVANNEPEEVKNPEKTFNKTLRIDHSRVHFDNGRLSERLRSNLSELSSHKHKQKMARNTEIEEIRQTIQGYKTLQKSQNKFKPNSGLLRPVTSTAYLCHRVKPSVANTVKIPGIKTSQYNSDGDSDDSDVDDDPFKNARARSAPDPRKRLSIVSRNSSNNGNTEAPFFITELKRPKTSQNNNPTLGTKNNGNRSFNRRTPNSSVQFANELSFGQNDSESKFQLLCERTQSLSRRKLIEMTNVDRVLESRQHRTLRDVMLEKHRQYALELDKRVQCFLKGLKESKYRNIITV